DRDVAVPALPRLRQAAVAAGLQWQGDVRERRTERLRDRADGDRGRCTGARALPALRRRSARLDGPAGSSAVPKRLFTKHFSTTRSSRGRYRAALAPGGVDVVGCRLAGFHLRLRGAHLAAPEISRGRTHST